MRNEPHPNDSQMIFETMQLSSLFQHLKQQHVRLTGRPNPIRLTESNMRPSAVCASPSADVLTRITAVLNEKHLRSQRLIILPCVPYPPFSRVDRLVSLHLTLLLQYRIDQHLWVRMNEEGYREPLWKHVP